MLIYWRVIINIAIGDYYTRILCNYNDIKYIIISPYSIAICLMNIPLGFFLNFEYGDDPNRTIEQLCE